MSLLLGYIISISSPFSKLMNFFFSPGVFGTLVAFFSPIITFVKFILSELFFPITSVYKLLRLFVMLIIDIITPFFNLIIELIRLVFSLIKLIFYVPTLSIRKIIFLLKDGLMGGFLFIKEVLTFFKSFVMPMAKAQNREATISFIQLCQQIGMSWS